jgi:hypothetical protein
MGVSRYLKGRNPDVRIVGLQPSEGASIAGASQLFEWLHFHTSDNKCLIVLAYPYLLCRLVRLSQRVCKASLHGGSCLHACPHVMHAACKQLPRP